MERLSNYALALKAKHEAREEFEEDEEQFLNDVDGNMDDFWFYISEANMEKERLKLFSDRFHHEIKCAVEVLKVAHNLMDEIACMENQ